MSGGWRGSEYIPRVCIEVEATVGMGGWGGWRGSEYIYIYPESVSRLRRLALVESGWDGGDGGAVSIQLHPESVSRLRRLAE